MFKYVKRSNESEISKYLKSNKSQDYLYKRTIVIIMLAQVFSRVDITDGVMVGALLAQSMLKTDTLSGMSMAVFTLGSAFAAVLIGFLTQKLTRRFSLSFGFFIASFGACGVVFSAIYNNIYFFFIFLFIYGFGTATNLQVKYTGTDLATKLQTAIAISMALVSTTLGAVFSPYLVQLTSSFTTNISIFFSPPPPLMIPFILASI